MLLQQYKVGEIKVSSGANIEGASDKPSLGAAVRVTATGITADKRAGDIKIIGVDAVYSTQERGMRLRFTLADTDVLFFCKDADGKTKPPGTGLLGGCEPKGIFGVGGKVIQIQHDGTTSRTAARWLDLNVVFNLLNNANTLEYIKERLNLYAGGSLDTTWTGNTPHAEDSANTLVRGNIGIMGMIRTDDFHWEFRGLAELRPNIADPINDYSVIAGGQALYHMTPRPNTVVDIGVDAHYQRNSIPSRSFGPFASDRLRDSGFIGLLLSFPLDGPIEDDAAPLLDH